MSSKYLDGLTFDSIHSIEKVYKRFLNRKIKNVEELKNWINAYSDLDDEINEILNKTYVEFLTHTDDIKIRNKFERDHQKIIPVIKKLSAEINQFISDNEFKNELDGNTYNHFLESVNNSLLIFRDENIKIEEEEDKLCDEYNIITENLTAQWNGNNKSMSQMAVYLENSNRDIRENAWECMHGERLKKAEKLDEIMNQLVKLRKQKSMNAGFSNYRDYMFRKYERFSYTADDCLEFHDSVHEYVVPLKVELERRHKEKLKIDVYRPWDSNALIEEENQLKPFVDADELIDNTIKMLKRTDKEFASIIDEMKTHGFLDLENRKTKVSCAFSEYFPVSKSPFISMNSLGTHTDLVAFIHECGHAIHYMLMNNIKISKYRQLPMESAEFGSLSMEFLSMDKWDEFYKNKNDLKKAKRKQLEDVIKFLPWAMAIDKFQHWMYLNPDHTADQRNAMFAKIAKEFHYPFVDWTSYEKELENLWKIQLHIFEAPFFYIEYAIALLGAIQLWRNYKENSKSTLQSYKKALALGNSKSLPEIYETAGVKFDFSAEMVKDLMQFVWVELEKLE